MTNLTALERHAGTRTSSLGKDRFIKAMNGSGHELALELSQESANLDPCKTTGQLRDLLTTKESIDNYKELE